ncbi:hypothetical protein CQA49_00785 [Helicobacter sp. MIT 00-7814]|uniref:MBL fold metallo-hydrolase n=1 Tax=unclassified Helicobacter TaxID=2593540 RepID=UPI000E1F21E8|nr:MULTISPECIES: MBL fold metallo-hydrolase [unclassified Helicobacter]RDU57228.1 hypothetical protein CQA49_00785 [Helicobacter sp. MIT 00-7814]RDU57780.1 hypothetical protein CQA37_00785 [Helicobacter sp. MIT 99-10781]
MKKLKKLKAVKNLCMALLCMVGLQAGEPMAETIFSENFNDFSVHFIVLETPKMSVDIALPTNKEQEELIKQIYPDGNAQNYHIIALVQADGINALVDTGYKETFFRLENALQNFNLTPKDITHIILTHGHKDHIGGLLDSQNKPNFPNATLLLDNLEYEYWANAPTKKTIKAINAYEKREFFNSKHIPIKNLSALRNVPAYGHTPGHNMILFQKGEQKILFIADLVHLFELQRLEPGISVSYDIDKLQAAQTRRDMLELYKDTRLIGAHFPFPAPLDLNNLKILEVIRNK